MSGQDLHGAEFEVLDRLSVDGYSVLRGSADIPGGGFSVGGSTFVVKGGNVGIGTTNPQSQLEVSGQASAGSRHTWLGGNLGGGAIPGDGTTLGASILGWNASSGAGETNIINAKGPGSPGGFTFDQWDGTVRTTRMYISGAAGNVGIGTTGPAAGLDVISGTSAAYSLAVGTSAAYNMVVSTAGKVGIGTINPGVTLDIVGTDAVKIPVGTTSQRPAIPANGMLRVNTTTGKLEYYNNSGWNSIGSVSATGGTVTESGGYRIHTFTASGTFSVTTGGNIEVLLVAGGGGGSGSGSSGSGPRGGGGGGGLIYNSAFPITGGAVIPVTVGAGGAGGAAGENNGVKGENSVFSTLSAVGGGYGASYVGGGTVGGVGGSAGGSCYSNTRALGTTDQGTAGGISYSDASGAGGGGGAGQQGGDAPATNAGGKGGDGKQYFGVYYAGGGGGGGYPTGSNIGAGGNGGGGAGGGGIVNATSGTANTGGGGGGRGSNSAPGAAGGSGIVIIRYPN